MGPNFSNHVLTLDYLILLCKLLISAEGLFQIESLIFPLSFSLLIFFEREFMQLTSLDEERGPEHFLSYDTLILHIKTLQQTKTCVFCKTPSLGTAVCAYKKQYFF